MLVNPTGQRKVKCRGSVINVNDNSVSLNFPQRWVEYVIIGVLKQTLLVLNIHYFNSVLTVLLTDLLAEQSLMSSLRTTVGI